MAEVLPAEGLLASSWLLIALPLAGAAVLLLGGRRTDRWGHLLGTATVVAAFVLAVLYTVQLADLEERSADVDLFTFISAGERQGDQQPGGSEQARGGQRFHRIPVSTSAGWRRRRTRTDGSGRST